MTNQQPSFAKALEGKASNPEETHLGSGSLSIAENDSLVGFELTMQGQMIHSAVFARQ
jgi:hypothetical protein